MTAWLSISDNFDCLMGVKQGRLFSSTLFGLFVVGLEQHLMVTRRYDTPFLSGLQILLLLYVWLKPGKLSTV